MLAAVLEASTAIADLSPDPFYVDQAKATLTNLDKANIFSECQRRYFQFGSATLQVRKCIHLFLCINSAHVNITKMIMCKISKYNH